MDELFGLDDDGRDRFTLSDCDKLVMLNVSNYEYRILFLHQNTYFNLFRKTIGITHYLQLVAAQTFASFKFSRRTGYM